MQNKERILHLDICDYRYRKICPLYSDHVNVSGQATDIFRTTERNGWKELSFNLPSVCMTEHGTEDNYRLEHLKAGFLIRTIDDKGTDWYIISEPKIQHSAYSKNVQVTAGHVSQLLKMKNLGLEFSDDEGNNVGTAEELLETILAGTGWKVGYVYPFAEKNGDTKRRSLKASAKTGAFKLITMMCDLFDAKPDFHGDSRTVDILPINPFSEPAPGTIPDLELAENVVELHYGRNVSNVTRTQNTDNIVTKLYAYGAYGDKTSGYCGIDECVHTEYVYMITEDCHVGETYHFSFEDASGVYLTYHFTPYVDIAVGSRLTYSLMDPSSMLYIWDDNHQNAYAVYKGTKGIQLPATVAKNEDVKNWFQFVMNFDYYRAVGLMTDEMIQTLGEYQRNAHILYQDAADASLAMSEAQTILSETIGYIDFCKLDIESQSSNGGYTALTLKKDIYKDGVIYRSDYDKNKDNYFKWRVTESLNTDGDPINSAAGLVYIVHDTNPVSWDKAYLKAVDNEDNPSMLTLWSDSYSMNIDVDTDQFFLFSYNGINGRLGTLESNDESAVMSLEDALRVVTVDHPVFFTDEQPIAEHVDEINGYGWLWKYNLRGFASELYFAYVDEGDTSWNYVYFTDSNPGGAEERSYWFNWRDSVLYRRTNSAWVQLDTAAEKKVAALFATVYMFCKARDRYYQGLSEYYTYTVPPETTLSAGNYFFENEYKSYWAFTTTADLNAGDTLTYNYDSAWITQTRNGVETTIKPKGYRFDNVNYHPSNILNGHGFEVGAIGTNGVLSDSTSVCRSQSFLSVVPSTSYTISGCDIVLQIHFYDDKQGWLSSVETNSSFTTPGSCTYIRVCANVSISEFSSYSNVIIAASDSNKTIVIEDLNYKKLDADPHGENIGLISCVSKFAEYADKTYLERYGELKEAQDVITQYECVFMESLGDVYREGWWNDASYVDGDEVKLYEDALENLNQVAKPEATYNITFLDLRDSNNENMDYGAACETVDVVWPDISHMDAIHLVDPEIAVNTWAFVDKIQKCHDKPWQTKIVINTNLSTIAQHSFTDVMTNIANVASDMKGKSSYYDKTINSAASNDDVSQVQASVSKNEKDLFTTASRVEEINGTVYTHTSQIKHTVDGIKSIVNMSDTDGFVYKGTVLQQTLDGFSVEITGHDKNGNPVENSLKQTIDGTVSRVQCIEESSIIKQTADAIQAVVRDNSNGENEFNTSSVSISKDGVAISTGGTFTVDSGNFDLDENGKLYASDALISGTLYSGNYPVMKNGYDVIVSSVQPNDSIAHQGMIWIKPGAPSSGGSSGGSSGDSGGTTNEVKTGVTTYSAYNNVSSRVSLINSSTYNHSYKNGFAVYGTGFNAEASKYTYSIELPMFIRYGGEGYIGGGDVTVKISNGSKSLSVTQRVTVSKSSGNFSGVKTFTISDSSKWLGDSNVLYVYAEVTSVSGYWRANVMDNSGTVTVTCTAS